MDIQTNYRIEDSELCYIKIYPIKYHEMDFNKGLKPSALMNFLQDMATENAEILGFGPSFVFPRNYAWFLIKYRMEFDQYPQDLGELVIKTEARGISKIIASRDFEIWTTDNKKLGRVASNWMMVDLETKRPLPLSKILPFVKPFEKRETDLSFEKPPELSRVDFEKTFKVRFDDIDVNQHVNNANYIVWALETLPWEFRASNNLKTLDIVYKKEISFGHSVISQTELDLENKISTHVLKNASTGDELCFLNIDWD